MDHTSLLLEWQSAVSELVTVEKKNIVSLTEVARDAVATLRFLATATIA